MNKRITCIASPDESYRPVPAIRKKYIFSLARVIVSGLYRLNSPYTLIKMINIRIILCFIMLFATGLSLNSQISSVHSDHWFKTGYYLSTGPGNNPAGTNLQKENPGQPPVVPGTANDLSRIYKPDTIVRYGFKTPNDSIILASRFFHYTTEGVLWKTLVDTINDVYSIYTPYYQHLYEISEFDTKGRVITEISGYIAGTDTLYMRYEYNEDDMLVRYRKYNGISRSEEKYTYDVSGIISAMTAVYQDCFHSNVTPNGVECLEWRPADTVYTDYNSKGLPVYEKTISRDTSESFYFYDYNSLGEISYIRKESASGNMIFVDSTVFRDTLENGKISEYVSKAYSKSQKKIYALGHRNYNLFDQSGNRVRGEYSKLSPDGFFRLEVVDSLEYNEDNKILSRYAVSTGNYFEGGEHLETYRYRQDKKLSLVTSWDKTYLDEWFAYQKDYYHYTATGPVTIKEYSADESFTCYPNPAAERVWIDISETGFSKWQYRIIDQSGRLALSGIADNPGLMELDISRLREGMYFVHLSEHYRNEKQGYTSFIKTGR